MNNLIPQTSATPVLGDQEFDDLVPIDYAELVNDEGFKNQDHHHFPNLNSFRCCPHGPASFDPARHRLIASADQDAMENRSLVANDSAQSNQNNEVDHVHAARSGLGDDEEGDGGSKHGWRTLRTRRVS